MPFHIEANAALGLLAALLWGGGDFGGSIAVKRGGGAVRSALIVILIGHVLSLAVVAFLALLRGEAFPLGATLLWGMGGGIISAVSLVAFYMALAQGHMGSAAAVSGLLCAAVPAAVSAFTEGTPDWRRVLGFLLAGTAIWLIATSAGGHATASRRALTLSILSGIGFGIYFVSLKYAGQVGILWPMGLSRIGSAATAALLLVSTPLWPARLASPVVPAAHLPGDSPGSLYYGAHAGGRAGAASWPIFMAWIVAGATLDTGGNLSFLAATRGGRLDVAAVLASMYPASTILLAAALLHERTTRLQRLGMLLALPAVVLITI